MLQFDEAHEIRNKLNSKESLWPIRVEFNFALNEMIVCTRKDIRFV